MKIGALGRFAAVLALGVVAVLLAAARPADAATSVLYNFDPAAPVAQAEPAAAGRARRLQEGPARREQAALDDPAGSAAGRADPVRPRTRGDSPDQCGVFFGANTLLNHGRCYYESGGKPYLVPLEYRWQPQLVYAPDTFTTALFQQMMANSKTGDFQRHDVPPVPRGLQRDHAASTAGSATRSRPATRSASSTPRRPRRWLAQNSLKLPRLRPRAEGRDDARARARSPATRSSS